MPFGTTKLVLIPLALAMQGAGVLMPGKIFRNLRQLREELPTLVSHKPPPC